MPKITIDQKEYDTEDMSKESLEQLAALQFTASELRRFQLHVAALQTAQNAYALALKKSVEGEKKDENVNIEGLGENIEFES